MEENKYQFKKSEGKTRLFMTLSTIFVTLSIFFIAFTKWALVTFGDLDFEQYLFTIAGPNSGTPKEMYIKVAIIVGIVIIVIALIMVGIYYFVRQQMYINKKDTGKRVQVLSMSLRKIIVACVITIFFGFSVYYTNTNLKISTYLLMGESEFIEGHYIKPSEENITFPAKKKNLVYIFLESFESTYFSKELGGANDVNLMPEMTKLLQEPGAVSFSHQDNYGGMVQTYGSGYSIAGMFAQQSGLPFKVPGDGNQYGVENNFIPGAKILGDVLEDEGYNLQFLAGADGSFGGVDNLYRTHGNFDVFDYVRAKKEGKLHEDYWVWWGYEDKKLYEYSKEFMEELSQKDEPFAIVIETIDSHFPGGYTDESCSTEFDQPYMNSIKCVDKLTADFIRYVQQQPYYEDTVIVIMGDHLSMDQEYFKTIDPNYERTVFNAFLNVDQSLIDQANTHNRKASAIDVFPTILRSMGVDIRGHRLGLGADLYSNQDTLVERYGQEHVHEELKKKSIFYMDEFLEQRYEE